MYPQTKTQKPGSDYGQDDKWVAHQPPLADFVTLYRHNTDRTYAYQRGQGSSSVIVALNDSGGTRNLSIPNQSVALPYTNGTHLVDLLGSGTSCTVSSGQCAITLDSNTPGVILAPQSGVNVTFTVNGYTTSWGQDMYVVGNAPELGNWNTANAVPLNWVDSDTWSGVVNFSSSAGQGIQYKYIVKSGGTVTWEGGSNHSYTVPASGSGSATDNWQP